MQTIAINLVWEQMLADDFMEYKNIFREFTTHHNYYDDSMKNFIVLIWK